MNKLLASLALSAFASVAFAQIDPTRPMVTGRGNVDVRPPTVVVTNQTQPRPASNTPANETIVLDKIQVTGSLIRHTTPPAPAAKR